MLSLIVAGLAGSENPLEAMVTIENLSLFTKYRRLKRYPGRYLSITAIRDGYLVCNSLRHACRRAMLGLFGAVSCNYPEPCSACAESQMGCPWYCTCHMWRPGLSARCTWSQKSLQLCLEAACLRSRFSILQSRRPSGALSSLPVCCSADTCHALRHAITWPV